MTSKSSITIDQVKLPAIHPGTILADELAEIGISVSAFSRALDVPQSCVAEIHCRYCVASRRLFRHFRALLAQSAGCLRFGTDSGHGWGAHRQCRSTACTLTSSRRQGCHARYRNGLGNRQRHDADRGITKLHHVDALVRAGGATVTSEDIEELETVADAAGVNMRGWWENEM